MKRPNGHRIPFFTTSKHLLKLRVFFLRFWTKSNILEHSLQWKVVLPDLLKLSLFSELTEMIYCVIQIHPEYILIICAAIMMLNRGTAFRFSRHSVSLKFKLIFVLVA